MSTVKEPGVFSEPRWLPKHEDYAGLLDPGARRRGDSSTSYTRFPVEGDAAAAISAAVPDARLVYLVRDPIERMISDYNHHLAVGVEDRSLDEALANYEDPENYYVTTSRYAYQLGRYLEHFDTSAVLVLEQEQLRVRRRETVRDVFAFLGVDPEFTSPEFSVELLKRDDYVRHGG